jgi:dUTP pyrophosphatase
MSGADAGPSAVTLRILRLPHAASLQLPAYHTAHASGLDLRAALPEAEPLTLAPGARALVPTGLVVELPQGCEGQIRPRSGLALKVGVTVLNSPGTVDADYRGEVMVLLVNLGAEPFIVARGDRIAQLVVARVEPMRIEAVEELPSTARGQGGFGSTG